MYLLPYLFPLGRLPFAVKLVVVDKNLMLLLTGELCVH
jgi:hypothetical protein